MTPVVEQVNTVPAPLVVNQPVPDWKAYKGPDVAGTIRKALEYAADSNHAATECEADRSRIRETQVPERNPE